VSEPQAFAFAKGGRGAGRFRRHLLPAINRGLSLDGDGHVVEWLHKLLKTK
jgi:hypothetical protein